MKTEWEIFKGFMRNKEYRAAWGKYLFLKVGRAMTYATFVSLALVAGIVYLHVGFANMPWTSRETHDAVVIYFLLFVSSTTMIMPFMSSKNSPYQRYWSFEFRRALIEGEIDRLGIVGNAGEEDAT